MHRAPDAKVLSEGRDHVQQHQQQEDVHPNHRMGCSAEPGQQPQADQRANGQNGAFPNGGKESAYSDSGHWRDGLKQVLPLRLPLAHLPAHWQLLPSAGITRRG